MRQLSSTPLAAMWPVPPPWRLRGDGHGLLVWMPGGRPGLMLFVRPWTARVAMFMCVATVGYLAAATISLPQYWVDPLGPWLKVLPMMALCLFVAATDARR